MENIIFEWESIRIDSFLTTHFWLSRNFFHHIISQDAILVNWKKIKKSYLLQTGDEISVLSLERYIDQKELVKDFGFVDIPIIFETQDYAVLNKPKWVLSHPNSIWDIKSPSIVGFLYHHYKWSSFENFLRAGLIHRLDKDTDGLMIVAKSEKWLLHFRSLFSQKSELKEITEKEATPLKKFYTARCHLSTEWKKFLNQKYPIVINEIVKPKIPHVSEYKMWITKILWAKIDWNYANLDIEILTWRTHQIRYHLSTHWLVICWDKLYWKKEDELMNLTAYKLIFIDPDNNYKVFEI